MTTCLVAGQGRLPGVLLDRLEAAGTPPILAELDGFPMTGRGTRPILQFRIETLGSFLAELRSRGVKRVCFAGAIGRPPLDPAMVDAATLPLVPRIMQALSQGDDAALRIVLALFEESGLTICAAHDLAPELLLPAGVATKTQPSDAAKRDAHRGADVLAALAAADLGQACVISHGQALAVEALPGTDWMLASLARARAGKVTPKFDAADPISWAVDGAADWLSNAQADDPLFLPNLPKGGVLVKAPKTGQDRRIDLPAIGPQTVRAAAAAGLDGVVIEAGGVMVLDAPEVVELADRMGLFLWVRAAS